MSKELRTLIRVLGQDIDGTKTVVYALAQVKGVGRNLAYAIVKALNLDPNMRFGYLSDKDIKRIEDAVRNPLQYGVPSWLLNRQKDPERGTDSHLIGSDLILRIKTDIDLMKKIRCWKGIRHMLGLKVRGQRTKTTGRKGMAVGVRRRRL
jgi:small subunit ribosomal protein S13